MGITRHYIKEKNFVLTLLQDKTDNSMLEEHVRMLTCETKDMHPLLELADASELRDLSGLTETGIVSSASMEIDRKPYNKDQLAIVVLSDDVYQLASMYSAISSYFRGDVKVFRDSMTAIKWLGMEDYATDIDKLKKQ